MKQLLKKSFLLLKTKRTLKKRFFARFSRNIDISVFTHEKNIHIHNIKICRSLSIERNICFWNQKSEWATGINVKWALNARSIFTCCVCRICEEIVDVPYRKSCLSSDLRKKIYKKLLEKINCVEKWLEVVAICTSLTLDDIIKNIFFFCAQ